MPAAFATLAGIRSVTAKRRLIWELDAGVTMLSGDLRVINYAEKTTYD